MGKGRKEEGQHSEEQCQSSGVGKLCLHQCSEGMLWIGILRCGKIRAQVYVYVSA